MCDVTDHKNHNTVSLEEESEEKKPQLMKTQKDTQQMIQDRIKKIQDVKHSAEVRKRNTEKEKAARVELFTDLIRSIERCQTELLEMMEEQQKAAEKQEEELIEELEQEITELKMRNTELEQLSHTEDHLHLLQIYSSLCSSRNTRNWSEISVKTDESLETLRRALTKLQDSLQEKLTLTEVKRRQQYAGTVCCLHYTRLHSDTHSFITDRQYVVLRNGNEYKAFAGPPVSLCVRVKPQRVGVFVDYEEGLLSFYDVESSSHLYSFTDQSFTGKLYPYFSPCRNDGGKNSTPLIITPVKHNK
ncbi:hypothetical protein PO909_004043 [Leuciscus waleckii]